MMAPLQHMLETAGPQAQKIAQLWWLVLALCALVLLGILVALAIALWRAPRATLQTPADVEAMRRPEPRAKAAVTIAISLSIAGLLTILTTTALTDLALARLPLQDAVNLQVTANQWWWDVRYDDPEPDKVFSTANEIVIPVGRPVVLRLLSNDVIHSFWVPNLAGKKDLIPGHVAVLTLRADKPGKYRGQCAEFCGMQHAYMAFTVTAVEPAEYQRWVESQREPAKTPAGAKEKRGQQLFLSGSCMMCHAIQGTPAGGRRGPDLTHVASRETLGAGRLPNDAGHLAGWIADPHRFKPGVRMPAHPVPPEDIEALVAYLRSLR